MKSAQEIARGIDTTGKTDLDLFLFIVTFIDQNKCGPFYSEMRIALDIIQGKTPGTTSKSHIAIILSKLEAAAKITTLRDTLGHRIPGRILLK